MSNRSFTLFTFFASASALLIALNSAEGASFTDDKGTTHVISKGDTVLCGAMDAVGFFHFGMETSQIEGTFGERSSSGSNYGGTYFDGNLADHGDHGNVEYNPEHFPADPDETERAFLNMITDYSPSCSSTNYYCTEIDIATLNQNGWPDVVVFGSYYSNLLTEDFRGNATAAGVPIIELTTAYGSSTEEQVLPRGMVEITQRWEELAISFLGDERVQATVKEDKAKLCAAAETFKSAAQMSQSRGVRAMAAYLPYAGTGDNGEVGAFIASPERDTVLAMMEELGMAILHNDAETNRPYEYAISSDFTTGKLAYENMQSAGALGDPVPYYVDFWLYDDRVTLDFLSGAFKEAWPHKALVAKQYAYFPSNARIYSYRHAAEILTIVAEPLKNAQQLFTDISTQCTPVSGGVAGEDHRSKGLLPGQYACHEPITYDFCIQDKDETSVASKQLDSKVATTFMMIIAFMFM